MRGRQRPLASLSFFAFVLCLFSQPARGQVVILPPPVDRPSVQLVFDEYSLTGEINSQVARLTIGCRLSNKGSAPGEADLLVPLPPGAVLHSITLLADGKELPGELLEKEKALNAYLEIVRRYRDPALVEYLESNLFRSRIFPVPPHGKRELQLSITFALTASEGTVPLTLPLPHFSRSTLKPERVKVDVDIRDRRPIRSAFSPESWLTVTREDSHHVRIYGSTTEETPGAARVLYRLDSETFTAWTVSYWPEDEDRGYFVLFVVPPAPEEIGGEYQPKDVILVIDTSGSMAGEKLEQAKRAARHILNNLRREDRFAVVTYSDDVRVFSEKLEDATPDSVERASRHVATLRARGGTNIEAALATSLSLVEKGDRPAYILFLTDGQPTVGEKDPGKLVHFLERKIPENARFISFGVGVDVNSALVDRLGQVGHGRTILVPPGSDLEREIAALYNTISIPALTEVELAFRGVEVSMMYPERLTDLFAGVETVLVGRYRTRKGEAKLELRGRIRDQRVEKRFELEFATRGHGLANAFAARLWAARRIGHLLEEIDIEGPQESLVDEIVRLSKRYGIPTPYTSFLAKEPDIRGFTGGFPRMGRVGAVGGGFGGAVSAPSGAAAFKARREAITLREADVRGLQAIVADTAEEPSSQQPRFIGGKTFYKTNDGWVEAGLDEQDLAKARSVEIGSEEFLELVKKLKPEERRILRLPPPIYVRIDGTVYRLVANAN